MRDDPRFDDPRLTALLFGELSEAEKLELEAELEADPSLDAELLSLLDASILVERALADAAGAATAPLATGETDDGSHAQAEAAVRPLRPTGPPSPRRTRSESLRVWGTFAAAAVLVLAVVVGINTGGSRSAAGPSALDATPTPPAEPTAVEAPTPSLEPEALTQSPESNDSLDTLELPGFFEAVVEPTPDPAPPAVVATERPAVTAPATPSAIAAPANPAPAAEPPLAQRRGPRRRVYAGSAAGRREQAPEADADEVAPPTAADPPPRRGDEAALLDAWQE